MITDEDRKRYRKIQDTWLKRADVKQAIEQNGWDAPIAWTGSPTYAEVRDAIQLGWIPWMIDHMRQA